MGGWLVKVTTDCTFYSQRFSEPNERPRPWLQFAHRSVGDDRLCTAIYLEGFRNKSSMGGWLVKVTTVCTFPSQSFSEPNERAWPWLQFAHQLVGDDRLCRGIYLKGFRNKSSMGGWLVKVTTGCTFPSQSFSEPNERAWPWLQFAHQLVGDDCARQFIWRASEIN